ncbi:unnamed protein product [Clavelina lepadiformis]|uniref:Small ribosomal subunit protein uS12m n=1 Tax=Clavelina lepadiformis TaxID=159417 RepID=A0ABP0F753_CLALP
MKELLNLGRLYRYISSWNSAAQHGNTSRSLSMFQTRSNYVKASHHRRKFLTQDFCTSARHLIMKPYSGLSMLIARPTHSLLSVPKPSISCNFPCSLPIFCVPRQPISTSGIDSDEYKYFHSIDQMFMKKGDKILKRKKRNKMFGKPQIRGVVLKCMIRKPKKPNSANRRCCKLRLSNGKVVIAWIPGEGHNLQEHHVVLVDGKRKRDLYGVHYRVIRGKYDCAHVVKG